MSGGRKYLFKKLFSLCQFFKIVYLMYKCVFFWMYIYALSAFLVTQRLRRGHQCPPNWSYRCLWATGWLLLLGTKPRASASTHNPWAASPALMGGDFIWAVSPALVGGVPSRWGSCLAGARPWIWSQCCETNKNKHSKTKQEKYFHIQTHDFWWLHGKDSPLHL